MLILHPKTAALLETVASKPPHALVLVAPAGAGKEAVARQLVARLLNTTEDKLENTAALLVVAPDKDQAFGIDSVRQARHFMTLKSHKRKGTAPIQRIALLTDAQNMTREAQNALLKLLEEPPEDSMLILTAVSEQTLLPTIISRSQVLKLQKPTAQQLTSALAEQGHNQQAIALALSISDGWPGLALAMLDTSTEHQLAKATEQARQLLQQTTFERLAQVDALAKKRELCVDTCYILQQMAHLALQSAKPEAIDRWQRVLRAGYDCQQALQTRVNAKLAMTQLMLSL